MTVSKKNVLKSLAILSLSATLFGAAGQAAGQSKAAVSPGHTARVSAPADQGKNSAGGTNLPPAWTNVLNNISNAYGWGTNRWWTNTAELGGNRPPAPGTNPPPRGVIGPGGPPPRGLPTDVQVVVRQFQRQSALLAGQLNNASDAQRKQILKQIEALREQLQSEVVAWRETVRQEGPLMRQFANPHPTGTPGGATKGTSRRGLE